jgi:hypothetical protein
MSIKSRTLPCLCLGLVATSILPAAVNDRDAVRMLGAAPVRFEPAGGPGGAEFSARGLNFGARLSAREAVVRTPDGAVRLTFQGANASARLAGEQKLSSVTNIIKGRDRASWRGNVANYGRLAAHDLYPGVDLAWYGTGRQLEYDLIVAPGADPRRIRMRFEGIEARIDDEGNLVAGILHRRPVSYQETPDGARIPVESRYVRHADGTFSIALGKYNRRRTLVIDPQVVLACYIFGSAGDEAIGVGHDRRGFIYVAGNTYSADLSLGGDPDKALRTGDQDLFIAKLDPNVDPAYRIAYCTYMGGTLKDTLNGMTVDSDGIVYLVGTTVSTDFPLVTAFSGTLNGDSTDTTHSDAFLAALDTTQPAGLALQFSSYLGGLGNDSAQAVVLDSSRRMVVTGATNSANFPIISGFQDNSGGNQDAFVVVIDNPLSGSAGILYSSFLGGSGWDAGRSIALAPDGTAWIVGATTSADFTFAGLSYQNGYLDNVDGFVVNVDYLGSGVSTLRYGTYLGGSGLDEATKVVVGPNGRVFVAGYTTSPDFPVTPNAQFLQPLGDSDAFLVVLNPAPGTAPARQLLYATYFGGQGADSPKDMMFDAAGNLWVTGFTASSDFPIAGNALQASPQGTFAIFLTRFSVGPSGALSTAYSTFISSPGTQVANGMDIGANGAIYLAGYSSNGLLNALGSDVAKSTNNGDRDAFVVGLNLNN